MITSKIKYLGNLRCELTHVRSGKVVVTDAPIDNNGKGEAFSPTDLAATSLGACMITIMGIAAQTHGFSIEGLTAEITKIMNDNPRMIKEVVVELDFHGKNYSEKDKNIILHITKTCPVALSLGPDTKQTIKINF
jgi:putative redox protein